MNPPGFKTARVVKREPWSPGSNRLEAAELATMRAVTARSLGSSILKRGGRGARGELSEGSMPAQGVTHPAGARGAVAGVQADETKGSAGARGASNGRVK